MLDNEGLHVVGLARSTSSAKRVEQALAGARVAATEDCNWQAQVAALAAGRKMVAVLDCVSGALVGDLAPLLADDAAIVTYGGLGAGMLGISGLDITDHQFVIRGVTFTRWFLELSQDEQARDIQSAIAPAYELPGLFRVSGFYSLADFQQAVSAVEAPQRDGFVFFKGREACDEPPARCDWTIASGCR